MARRDALHGHYRLREQTTWRCFRLAVTYRGRCAELPRIWQLRRKEPGGSNHQPFTPPDSPSRAHATRYPSAHRPDPADQNTVSAPSTYSCQFQTRAEIAADAVGIGLASLISTAYWSSPRRRTADATYAG